MAARFGPGRSPRSRASSFGSHARDPAEHLRVGDVLGGDRDPQLPARAELGAGGARGAAAPHSGIDELAQVGLDSAARAEHEPGDGKARDHAEHRATNPVPQAETRQRESGRRHSPRDR